MQPVTVTITSDNPAEAASVELQTPDVRTALMVADINVDHGIAELRQGPRVIARVRKHGDGHATYWEVG